MEEGDIGRFFKDLGLALAPKMCSDQSQALNEVNNGKAFSTEKNKNKHFFLNKPLQGAPRQVCIKFSANIRRTDCVGPILSHI